MKYRRPLLRACVTAFVFLPSLLALAPNAIAQGQQTVNAGSDPNSKAAGTPVGKVETDANSGLTALTAAQVQDLDTLRCFAGRSIFDPTIDPNCAARVGILKNLTSSPQKAVPAAVGEAFSIIAEIVVDRAKKNGLEMVRKNLEDAVCNWTFEPATDSNTKASPQTKTSEPATDPNAKASPESETNKPATDPNTETRPRLFPQLCELIKNSDLERIIGNAAEIRAALTRDLETLFLDRLENVGSDGPMKSVRPAVETLIRVSFQALARKDQEFTSNESELVVDALVNAQWDPNGHYECYPNFKNTLKDIQAGLYAARAYIRIKRTGSQPPPIPEIVRILSKPVVSKSLTNHDPGFPQDLSPEKLQKIARWATMAVDAALATKDERGRAIPDPRQRVRRASDLILEVALELSPDCAEARAEKGGSEGSADCKDEKRNVLETCAENRKTRATLKFIRDITDASLDGNYARAIAAIASQAGSSLATHCPKEGEKVAKKQDDCARKQKYAALLSAVAGYAGTFEENFGNDTGTDAAALAEARRQARKEALEGLIDQTTVRVNREGDWVVSIGANLGALAYGRQRLQVEPAGQHRGTSINTQLALDLGIAFQKLPAKGSHIGFHSMLTFVDIGQYVAWDGDNGSVDATWGTLAAPGAQAGIAIGKPNNFFTISAQATYGPKLFDVQTSTGIENSGAWRYGLSIQYFVSLFDFN